MKANKYQWPDSDKQTVNCPNCTSPCELDLELVKKLTLPLRPAHCHSCNAEFELNHDGTTTLTFSHPKERRPNAGEAIRKINRMVFDPR